MVQLSLGICPESTAGSDHVSSELTDPLTSRPDTKLYLQQSAGFALIVLLKQKKPQNLKFRVLGS